MPSHAVSNWLHPKSKDMLECYMEFLAETEFSLGVLARLSLVGRGNVLSIMLLSTSDNLVMLNSSRSHHTAFQESV